MYDKYLKQVIIKRADLFKCLALFNYSDNLLVSAGSIWCNIQVGGNRELELLKRNEIGYKVLDFS